MNGKQTALITTTFSTKTGGRIEGVLCEPPNLEKLGGAQSAGGEPSPPNKKGALVIVHEWYGLNEVMKLHCVEFAQAGFLALVPDLYHGKVAKDDEEAAKMIGAFDFQKAVGEIGETVAYLRSQPRCNGKVAVVGFCLGGALTLAAARHIPTLDAAVPFYGLPRFSTDEFTNVKTPICGHYARVDEWADPSVAAEIQEKVRASGGQMDLHIYDASHAFMRSTDKAKYDPESAELAWQRTVEFLNRHIG